MQHQKFRRQGQPSLKLPAKGDDGLAMELRRHARHIHQIAAMNRQRPHPVLLPQLAHRLASGRRYEAMSELRRSEEHTSELQSPDHLVCRLLLEKKKTIILKSNQIDA